MSTNPNLPQTGAQESSPPPSPDPVLPVAPPAAGSQADPAPQDPPAAPAKAERPSYIPEQFWNQEAGEANGEAFIAAFSEAQAAKTAADERMAAVPADAASYAVDLPEGIELPEGYTIKQDDPLLAAGRELAFELKLPQAEFGRFAGLFVKHQIDQHNQFQTRMGEERAKLGPNAEARVSAVTTALISRLGEEAKPFIKMLIASEMVSGFEKLLNSGGEYAFGQNGRVGGRQDGRPDNWDQLSALDRRAYDLANPRV